MPIQGNLGLMPNNVIKRAGMKQVIGLTGGIGSGKSRVLNLLENQYNVQIIKADEVAHELMEPGNMGFQAVITMLGQEILQEDGNIDKQRLSALMFHNPTVLEMINRKIHPLVWNRIKEMIRVSDQSFVLVEAALLSEEKDDIYDELWYVYTSRENRIRRLAENRGYSEEKSLSIMKNQPSEKEFRSRSQKVIDNNGTLEDLKCQLETIWKDKGKTP